MEDLAFLIRLVMVLFLTFVMGMVVASLFYAREVDAGYGYKWKCGELQVVQVKSSHVEGRSCERVKDTKK